MHSNQIPQGDIDLLPVNFFVNNLLSVVALYEDSEGSTLECGNCESGDPPVNRCATCSYSLCEFCTQAHQRGRSTSSHTLVPLEGKKIGSVAMKKTLFCKEHEGELIKLFCETCQETICRDCAVMKHRDHKYIFVKEAFSKGKESLLKILSDTEAKSFDLKEAVDGVLEMKRSVHISAEQTLQEVVDCFNEMMASLDSRRGKLIARLEEVKNAKLKSLEIQQEELETALGIIQSSVEFTKTALENGSEVEILNRCKQMARQLQDLNSSKCQLQPSADYGLKFKSDSQLKIKLATFGTVTDVVTCAALSTVSMGNGQEGVMYNTLCREQIEFTITAKERNGRKQTEGGDSVLAATDLDVVSGNPVTEFLTVSDGENGTYSFCYTPEEEGYCELSVTLNGRHVQGSPFTWSVEKWNLLLPSSLLNSGEQLQLSDENLIAEYKAYCTVRNRGKSEGNPLRQSRGNCLRDAEVFFSTRLSGHRRKDVVGASCGFNPDFSSVGGILPGSRTWTLVAPGDQQHPDCTSARPCAVGSVGFYSGRHMWRVQVFGNILQGFTFGVRSTMLHDTPGQQGKWWVWNSRQVYKSVNGGQAIAKAESTITDCASGDIIEMYLDCENGTFMMHNSRTKQSDTVNGVEGEVLPVFCMTTNGDKVSLKI